jgi:hypothetical protein
MTAPDDEAEPRSDDARRAETADGGRDGDTAEDTSESNRTRSGDTFGVGIHVTETDLRFVVHVPSDIDSGWTDPDEFQRLVERVVWDRLDRDSVLRGIASTADTGDTVTLGRVTLRPDGTVVDASLDAPARPATGEGDGPDGSTDS